MDRRCAIGLAGTLLFTSLSSVNPAAAAGVANNDGFDDLRSKNSCRSLSSESKIEKFARAWTQAIDDVNMTKCFMTLTTQEQAKAWETFVSLGGGMEALERNKPKILAENRQLSREELQEFNDPVKPVSKHGSTKVLARPIGVRPQAFSTTNIGVSDPQYWARQINWQADNWIQNNNCDGDANDPDWEYIFFFGEPMYSYQFLAFGSAAPVAALLSYYVSQSGGVLARATGDGNLRVCIGNGSGYLPAWYVSPNLNTWR
jgi:hypothetical protein